MKISKALVWGVLAIVGGFSQAHAASITLTAIPAGSTTGTLGMTIGFGYTIVNNSTFYYQPLALNTGSFAHGTPDSIFDFPEVAPGATVTEIFTPSGGGDLGLFEVLLGSTAGTDAGTFTLIGEFYQDINETVDAGAAPNATASYSITVNTTTTPEPATLPLLLVFGTAALAVLFIKRN